MSPPARAYLRDDEEVLGGMKERAEELPRVEVEQVARDVGLFQFWTGRDVMRLLANRRRKTGTNALGNRRHEASKPPSLLMSKWFQ
jgi:hypothetical protein